MAPGDVARLYHRLSSYWHVPGTEWPPPIDHPLVRQDFVPNHRPTFPPHRKAYPDGLPSVELPAAWPRVPAPAIEVLAGRHTPATRPLDLEGLARILHLSAGVGAGAGAPGRAPVPVPAGRVGRRPLSTRAVRRCARGARATRRRPLYDPVDHALRQ